MTDYQAFLARKTQLDSGDGFAPTWMPDWLFDLIGWATPDL